MLTRTDIVLRAHQVGAGLTDRERIALGATLIETVIDPRYHPEMAYTVTHLRDHAEALRDAFFDLDTPDGPGTGKATTHEQMGLSGSCGAQAPQSPAPRAASSSRWRAAWDRIVRAERWISDSWIGEGIAGVCIAILLIGALFAPLFLPV
ncbi:hypothetical protein KUV64_05155 [Mameliella alba]|uniref:hypothetical protein n=1 Tax=Mameliella alba TaxID=561184 RepID=UPI001C984189|nr:hypothetical protein [Mameliella alba]MBY6118510.1 hypothetical protein [Mameliella alba]